MSVLEQIEKQFREYIALQAFDDKYIDRQEEKKILLVLCFGNLIFNSALLLLFWALF